MNVDQTFTACLPATGTAAPSNRVLVIGYGNTLRQDDGAGPIVAERIDALRMPQVHALACPQLSPEHVPLVADSELAVFIDACVDGSSEVQLRPAIASASSQVTAHALEPATLLALARDVFGRTPPAWILTIPAVALGFGENLSPVARVGVESAVDRMVCFLSDPPQANNDSLQGG